MLTGRLIQLEPNIFMVSLYLNCLYGSISVKDTVYICLRGGVVDHVDVLGVYVS